MMNNFKLILSLALILNTTFATIVSNGEELKPKKISKIDFFQNYDDEKPSALTEKIQSDLLMEISKIDFDEKIDYQRDLKLAPDAKIKLYFSDSTELEVYLHGRVLLVDKKFTRAWSFTYGKVLLKSIDK
jgi:hypothetical protein